MSTEMKIALVPSLPRADEMMKGDNGEASVRVLQDDKGLFLVAEFNTQILWRGNGLATQQLCVDLWPTMQWHCGRTRIPSKLADLRKMLEKKLQDAGIPPDACDVFFIDLSTN